jgi:DNA mismatch endonuclease, patch repair protein
VAPDDYPAATDEGVSIRMRGNRRRDTKPEVAIRSALHRLGLRFRVDHPVRLSARTVRPDIVFTKRRLAVFVDGCFWHRCPIHGSLPQRNADYWLPKLDRNVQRDFADVAALSSAGWRVLRVWEHEHPEQIAERIAGAIDAIR